MTFLAAAAILLVSQSDLDRKVESVLPQPAEERWLRIPWQLNLAKARAESQRAEKPLLLWVMDGHVLGCT